MMAARNPLSVMPCACTAGLEVSCLFILATAPSLHSLAPGNALNYLFVLGPGLQYLGAHYKAAWEELLLSARAHQALLTPGP